MTKCVKNTQFYCCSEKGGNEEDVEETAKGVSQTLQTYCLVMWQTCLEATDDMF